VKAGRDSNRKRRHGTGSGSDLVLALCAFREGARSLPLPVPYRRGFSRSLPLPVL